MNKIKNNKLAIAIGTLSLVTLLAIIYATFTGQVQINGTSNIRDSKWDSHFTDISNAITTGTAKEITSPTINQEHPNTINDYEVSLTTPGDSISYELEVTNEGDYDAILTDYTINAQPICKVGNSTDAKSAQDVCEYLEYKITYKGGALLQKNVDILKSKEKAIFVITLTYKEFNDSSKLPTENVSIEGLQVSVTYSQGNNKAKVNKDGTTPYVKEYNVGDEITVAGEQYYVIADSNYNQDYVTALKANPLTINEINANKIGSDDINHVNRYTNFSVGEAEHVVGYGGMAYYSSPTCGYATPRESWTYSGCENEEATNYHNSDIKYVIDNWTTTTFQSNDLKDVLLAEYGTYKSRLITKEEYEIIQTTENWRYNYNSGTDYWTMSQFHSSSFNMWVINSGGSFFYQMTSDRGVLVRPVINVYKSAIEN